MEQNEFLIKFEQICGVKKPIFINSSDTFAVTDESLRWAKDLTATSIGRYRLTNKNSDVCELWIDVDNHDGIPFKQYKEERLTPSIQKLNNLGVSNDYIFPKVSGTGIHLHVFISDLPTNVDINDLFAKATPESADQRSLVEKHKIREYGADTSTKKGFCGYMSIGELLKARQLPTFKEAVFPQIKLFKCSPEFFLNLSLIKADREQTKIEKDAIVDYERDGDFMNLFKCPLVANLAKKSEQEHHLYHNERLFLMCQFIHFGEESRKKFHEIISHCDDYKEKLTQDFIDHAMNANYHPITCKWAKDMRLGCPPDCKGSGGKSPIKFAWTPLSLDDLKKEYRKILLLAPEDDIVIDILLATILDPKIEGELVWLFFIAPAAWGKTVILKSLHDPKWSRLEDSITPQTFISGKTYKDKKTGEDRLVEGLLPKLNGKTLIIKEFTTELMHGEEVRNDVFGQLRAIHDRYFSKTFGSIDVDKIPEEWKHVKMGFIAGCVPYIDRYGTLNVLLGERYLKLRLRQPPRTEAAKIALMNAKQIERMQVILSKKVKRFIANIQIPEEITEQDPPEEYLDKLANLGEFIVQCRKPVTTTRDGMGIKLYEYEDLTELPTRVSAQLWKLGKMLMIVTNVSKFDKTIYKALIRVAFDTIPQERLGIILTLYNEKQPMSKTRISEILKWDYRKVIEHTKQMVYLGLLHTDPNDNYYLDEYIRATMKKANILEKVRGTSISGLVDYNIIINNTAPSLKDLQYGKYHENVVLCSDGAVINGGVTTDAKKLYGEKVASTSYLQNRCMVCGRVPVGKNFELIRDGYVDIIVKFCRGCYVRWFYERERIGDYDMWEVLL